MDDTNQPQPTRQPTPPSPRRRPRQLRGQIARSPVQRVQHLLHSHPAISPLLVLIVSWLVFSPAEPAVRRAGLALAGPPAGGGDRGLAVGQTLIILTAGIDLSVGAIAIFVDARAAPR